MEQLSQRGNVKCSVLFHTPRLRNNVKCDEVYTGLRVNIIAGAAHPS